MADGAFEGSRYCISNGMGCSSGLIVELKNGSALFRNHGQQTSSGQFRYFQSVTLCYELEFLISFTFSFTFLFYFPYKEAACYDSN